ncbi:UNVERIFIED_CONTAM: hypothetical protein FKN15_072194 [Acipenser sinensis]
MPGPRACHIRLSGQDILWLVCGVPNPLPSPEGEEAGWWAFALLGVIPHHLCPAIIHGDSGSQAAALQKPVLPAHSWSEVTAQMRAGTLPQSRRMRSLPSQGTPLSRVQIVMMGQQSLLMSLAKLAPPVSHQLPGPTSQPVSPPQPIPVPVPQLHQEWDVDDVSRDASDGEPLLEENSAEAELTSQPSEQDVELEVLDTNDPTEQPATWVWSGL